MKPLGSITSRSRLMAAKRRIAAASVAPVASGYERSLRPSYDLDLLGGER